jgi:hypothetical protein
LTPENDWHFVPFSHLDYKLCSSLFEDLINQESSQISKPHKTKEIWEAKENIPKISRKLLKPKGGYNDSIIPPTQGKMILKGIVKLTCNGQADILE